MIELVIVNLASGIVMQCHLEQVALVAKIEAAHLTQRKMLEWIKASLPLKNRMESYRWILPQESVIIRERLLSNPHRARRWVPLGKS